MDILRRAKKVLANLFGTARPNTSFIGQAEHEYLENQIIQLRTELKTIRLDMYDILEKRLAPIIKRYEIRLRREEQEDSQTPNMPLLPGKPFKP